VLYAYADIVLVVDAQDEVVVDEQTPDTSSKRSTFGSSNRHTQEAKKKKKAKSKAEVEYTLIVPTLSKHLQLYTLNVIKTIELKNRTHSSVLDLPTICIY
jgi:hypothetical protein